jgi:hypothetical protein
MRFLEVSPGVVAFLAVVSGVSAVTVKEINGLNYRTQFTGNNSRVQNVQGIVTGRDRRGVFIRGVERIVPGNSIYVFDSRLATNTSIVAGDIITLDGRVTEYRNNSGILYLTEIQSPTVTDLVKGSAAPEPWVIGVDTPNPPTEQYTSLDHGNIFAVPNNQSSLMLSNPTLEPSTYGLDFWQSLSGASVRIRKPVAVSKGRVGSFIWVVGDWPTTGRNTRGGLTMTGTGNSFNATLILKPSLIIRDRRQSGGHPRRLPPGRNQKPARRLPNW